MTIVGVNVLIQRQYEIWNVRGLITIDVCVES
jgi:hypothetical protein